MNACRRFCVTRRTIPKTTSGKIARAMCKKAHVSGALDNDTVFLWGSDTAGIMSSASAAEMDAQAERDETSWSPLTGGSGGGGVEESKSFRGEGGGRVCPKDLPVGAILEGVQSEVARILKADATAIPTVRRGCGDGCVLALLLLGPILSPRLLAFGTPCRSSGDHPYILPFV